ncbi:MAG: hypothetical protein ACJAWW_002341 [Sulfurimonas sp.]|jgi:hypothetical protein
MLIDDEIKNNLWYEWFNKTREEQVNEEYLVIFGKEETYFDELQKLIYNLVYATKETVTLKDKGPHSDEYSYQTPWCDIYIINTEHRLKSLEEINKNIDKNIVLFVNEIYEDFFYDLKTLNCPLLYTDIAIVGISEYSNMINDLDNSSLSRSNLTKSRRSYRLYIEEFPIIMFYLEILDFPKIEDFLFYNILDNTPISSNIEYLIKDTAYVTDENSNTLVLIEADFYLFQDHLILTSRLAIVLYRLSTLDLKANRTQIGIFYRDTLNFKSEIINLKNSIFIKLPSYMKKTFRGYDLTNKPKTENEIRVEIAKKLLKNKVDEKIIFKATKVSKEMLLKY